MKKLSKKTEKATKLKLEVLSVRTLTTRELVQAQGGMGSRACEEGTGSWNPPC